jgi:hypothetical protein
MYYAECPETYSGNVPTLFLAGGIVGCPDWQAEMVAMLGDTDLVLLNPRRHDFPIHDPKAAEFQIKWEHEHLRKASAILFWFPCETLCPIVLYELGAWSMTDKTLLVGVHPEYKRRQDVEIQTRLVRPDVQIVHSLSELSQLVKGVAQSLGSGDPASRTPIHESRRTPCGTVASNR